MSKSQQKRLDEAHYRFNQFCKKHRVIIKMAKSDNQETEYEDTKSQRKGPRTSVGFKRK